MGTSEKYLSDDLVLDELPGRAAGDVLPPPGDVRGARVLEELDASVGGHAAVRKMEEIGEGEFVTSEILLLAEDLVVDLEVRGEGLSELGDARVVGLATTHGDEDLLGGDAAGRGIKVSGFDRSGLLEETVGKDVLGGVGEEVGLVLEGEVAGDGAALVDELAIILEDGDLAERLELEEFGALVGAGHHVNVDELERNIEFLQDDSNATAAGGEGEGVELENHCRVGRMRVGEMSV